MATSVSNTAFLVGNGFSQDGQSSADLLVAAYVKTRQPAVNVLQTNQDKLTKQQIFFNSVRSKLEALQANTSIFSESTAAEKFVARKVASSDATVASVSATSAAPVGVSTLKVGRLATNDSLLSDKVTNATTFSAELASRGLAPGIGVGAKSFSVNGRAYNVTLDGTETNEGVMGKVVTAINADSDAKVSASVVKDTANTGRLTFTSKSLGVDGAITFSDTSSLLSGFGFGSIKQSTGPSALSTTSNIVDGSASLSQASGTKNFSVNGVAYSIGYNSADNNNSVLSNIVNAINTNGSSSVTASVVNNGGTNVSLNIVNNLTGGTFSLTDTDGFLGNFGINTQSQSDLRTVTTSSKAGYANGQEAILNSLSTVNGIAISRSTNTLSDVLTGVTINLLKPQAAADSSVTLTTSLDADAVASNIQPFLDSYNEALRYLSSNNKTLGGNDGTIRSLTARLRSSSANLFGSESDTTKYLSDAGIKISKEGALSIENKDTLKKLLESDPTKVSKLFVGSSGFAAHLNSVISEVVGSEGLAQTRSNTLGTQVKTVSTKLTALKAKIDREATAQKNEYVKLQRSFAKMQDQFSSYSNFR